jgi:serine/threonine protein kinase
MALIDMSGKYKEIKMTDYIGQRLGNYQIIRLLGKGGFAEVYLGKHVHLQTMAAIKVLAARLVGNEVETFYN